MSEERLKRLRARRAAAMGVGFGLLAVMAAVAVALRMAAAPPRSAESKPSASPSGAAAVEPESPRRGPAVRAGLEEAMASARSYLNKGEAAKAEAIARALVERDAEDQDSRVMLAECLLALDRGADALEQYERAISIGPDGAELRFAAGTVASQIGKPERAVEHYRAARAMDPSNPKHPLYLAQVERALGRVEAAKESLVRAAALDPDQPIAWAALADMALQEGNLPMARQHIVRARALEPTNARWRVIEARVHRRENRPEEAVRLLLALGDAALADDAAATQELALCYGLLGRPGDAAAAFMRMSARRTEDAGAALGAAEWLVHAGRPDEALVFARAAAGLGSAEGKALAERLSGAR